MEPEDNGPRDHESCSWHLSPRQDSWSLGPLSSGIWVKGLKYIHIFLHVFKPMINDSWPSHNPFSSIRCQLILLWTLAILCLLLLLLLLLLQSDTIVIWALALFNFTLYILCSYLSSYNLNFLAQSTKHTFCKWINECIRNSIWTVLDYM